MRIACACLFIAIGILGLILPVMPGWPFVLCGFSILIHNVPLVARLHARCSRAIERRWPRTHARLVAIHTAYHRVVQALSARLVYALRRVL